MQIVEKREEGITLLGLTGRLDANTSAEFEKRLLALLDENEKYFLIDLAGLEYISSVGLRVLLMAAKKSKAAGGRIVLSSLQEHVQEVFEIAGFTAIFPIFPRLEEAMASFSG